jgi:hypothetical protein
VSGRGFIGKTIEAGGLAAAVTQNLSALQYRPLSRSDHKYGHVSKKPLADARGS